MAVLGREHLSRILQWNAEQTVACCFVTHLSCPRTNVPRLSTRRHILPPLTRPLPPKPSPGSVLLIPRHPPLRSLRHTAAPRLPQIPLVLGPDLVRVRGLAGIFDRMDRHNFYPGLLHRRILNAPPSPTDLCTILPSVKGSEGPVRTLFGARRATVTVVCFWDTSVSE